MPAWISFAWITDLQLMASVLGIIALIVSALLNIGSWTRQKDAKTGLRAAGFLLLALWAAVHNLGSAELPLMAISAALLFIGSISVAASFVVKREETAALDEQQKAQAKQVEKILKGPAAEPAKPAGAPARETVTPPPSLRQPLSASKAGLRTETLVKLPKIAKRRRARTMIILLTLFLLALIGLGLAYYVVNYTDLWENRSAEDQLPFVEEEPLLQETGTPAPTATPTPEPKPTVTVLETEVGYLNVREGSGTDTPVLTQVKPGESYELLEKSEAGDWVKIQIDEDTAGWVAARYVNEPQGEGEPASTTPTPAAETE